MPGTSLAIHPYGAKFQSNANDDGTTFADVAGVISINKSGQKVGEMKATHLQSPNAALEFGPAMIQPGTYTVTCHFLKTLLSQFYGWVRTTKNWRVLYPLVGAEGTPSRWDFVGFITNYDDEIPDPSSDTAIIMTFEITITGKPSFTQGV